LAVVPDIAFKSSPLGFDDLHHSAHHARDVASSKWKKEANLLDIVLLTPPS